MKAETFVSRLEQSAPTADQLIGVGLSENEASEFRSSFLVALRSDYKNEVYDLLEIGRLLSKYDVSNVIVGMVRFEGTALRIANDWKIGSVEADPLMVDGLSGEVYVADMVDSAHVIWFAAQNCNLFLSALISAAEFLGRCAVDEDIWNDNQAKKTHVDYCADLAGGTKYRDFYSMLLGAL